MARKMTELDSDAIHVIDLPDPRPLFVRADQIGRVIIGLNPKTAANWRCAKVGPRYFLVGSKPFYRIADLEDYFGRNPVQTTGTSG